MLPCWKFPSQIETTKDPKDTVAQMANINKPVPDTTDELERKYLVHNVMNDDSDEEMGRKARLEFDSDVSLSEDEADIAKHKHNDDCAHEEQGEDWSK